MEELCSSVKEPEEDDHVSKCHLLHDGKSADHTVSEASGDWLYILGHDRLKKRVSNNIVYLYIAKKLCFQAETHRSVIAILTI